MISKSFYSFIALSIIAYKLSAQNPIIVAPADIVISCGFQFTDMDLLDTSGILFGKVEWDSSSRKKLYTNDIVCHRMCEDNPDNGYPGPAPYPPVPPAGNRACLYYESLFDTAHFDRTFDLVWGFDGYIKNPISSEINLSIWDNRNNCGEGKIQRIFSIAGKNNKPIVDTQTIWVVNCLPFFINIVNPCDTTDDVDWPNCDQHTFVYYGCGNSTPPDSIHLPLPKYRCATLSITYADSIDVKLPEHYFIDKRQWTIIDWCQYDIHSRPPKGVWVYTDTIDIVDNAPPANTIHIEKCMIADYSGNATVSIDIQSEDNCTPSEFISCRYLIDLNNDGIGKYNGYDLQVGTLNLKEFKDGIKPVISDNIYATSKDNPFNAGGLYPVGKHKIVFITEDGQRNIKRDSAYFEILHYQIPEFKCPVYDFNVEIELPKTYIIDFHKLIVSNIDDCNPYIDFRFSLSSDSTVIQDAISCIDYINNGSQDTLRKIYHLFVTEKSGFKVPCSISVNYIFKGNCDPLHTRYFKGEFVDRNDKEIHNIDLDISSKTLGTIHYSTGCTNSYQISTSDLDTAYSIIPSKTNLLYDGIDVLDMLLLRDEVLGFGTLDKLSLLAGSVTTGNSITYADFFTISKLILRIPVNHPSTAYGLWRYYNAIDSVELRGGNMINDTSIRFICIKKGDVNGDAIARCNESRIKNIPCLNLTTNTQNLEKGKSYSIPVYCSNCKDIIGLQATIHFDINELQIDTITKGKTSPVFNIMPSLQSKGVITFLMTVDENFLPTDTLFTIQITALDNYSGNDFFRIQDDPTYSVAYDTNENPLQICMNSIPTNTSNFKNDALIIYPNPTNGNFNIRIPENTNSFTLKIFNTLGQCVYTNEYMNYSDALISIGGKYIKEPGAYSVTLQSRNKAYNSVLIKD